MWTEPPAFQNILLIQLRRIGDVLMTTPALRALRQAFPQAKITFLTEPPSHEVLQHNPYLNEVWVLERKMSLLGYGKMLWQLRQKRFDLVIDFFSNPKSAQMSWMSRAPCRIGFDFPGRGFYYTKRVALQNQEYAAEHKLLLLQDLGIPKGSLALDFFISASDEDHAEQLFANMGIQPQDFVVSLSPVSRQPYKVWPARYFAGVADHLIEQFGAKILFIHGPGEEHFVQAVRQNMQQNALPDYPVPTLAQTKAIFQKVHLHLGNDNGPCHFAISAGTPTVTVFGKPKAANWTPPADSSEGFPRHQAVEYDPGCKNQCTYPRCEHLSCINEVPLEQVKQTVCRLIERQQLAKKTGN